jgi:Tfp pilus assembly protein PilV
MVGTTARHTNRSRRAGKGFSLVELLVASFLMVTVMLAIIPLFMRSIQNNSAGNDHSQVSNYSKSQIEEMFQLDFDHARLDIPAGQTEVATDEYWSRADHEWKPGLPASGLAPWIRTTTVRQYNVSAIDGDPTNFDFPKSVALDGGAAAGGVHLKEVIVTVRTNSGPLGPSRRIVLRTLKAK